MRSGGARDIFLHFYIVDRSFSEMYENNAFF